MRGMFIVALKTFQWISSMYVRHSIPIPRNSDKNGNLNNVTANVTADVTLSIGKQFAAQTL